MIAEIYNIFTDRLDLLAVAGILFSWLIGNRLTVDNDRRKDFNAIFEPVYWKMKSQIDSRADYIENIDAARIERYLPWYEKWLFRYRVRRYNESKKGLSTYTPETGLWHTDEIIKTKVLKRAANVLHYLKPR